MIGYCQEVDRVMAATYAEEIGALYVETSAKEDICIHDMFTQLSTHAALL